MRCDSCSQITVEDLRNGCEVLQQPDFVSLKTSAESGCDLCNLSYVAMTSTRNPENIDALCQGYLPRLPDDHDTGVRLRGRFYDHKRWNESNHKLEKVDVVVGNDLLSITVATTGLGIYAHPESPPARYIAGRIPSPNPGNQDSLLKVKRWVQNCAQKHRGCAFLSETRPLPRRIIDIADKPIIRETNGVHGRYIALAYCWGRSGKNILLTKATYDDFTTVGIEMETLAKTIRDAIVVCRNLDIKNLWVDALCIIQEERDLADFKNEAPRMSEYYSNAYLTVIAGSARDCADGFLNDRPKPQCAPCEIVYSRVGVHPDTADHDMTGIVRFGLPPSKEIGPTLTRAWCFQEAFLSRRSLTYGSSQIHFRCPLYETQEDGDFKVVSNLADNWTAINVAEPSLHDIIEHDDAEDARKYAYWMWYRCIFSYSIRKMSKSVDRLAAIAGLARWTESVVQCKYLYGLWDDDLITGLTWRTIPFRNSRAERVADRAPSWSWASVDGAISISGTPVSRKRLSEQKNLRLKIVSHENVSGAFDPIRDNIGPPKAFELNVCGQMRVVWYAPPESHGLRDFHVIENEPPSDANAETKGDYIAIGRWDTHDDYESKRYWGRQVHALLLSIADGLLLIHVNGNHYRRIGLLMQVKEEKFHGIKARDITLI